MVTVDRVTGVAQRHTVGYPTFVNLVGGLLSYGSPTSLLAEHDDPLRPFRAASLAEPGQHVEVLAYVSAVAPAADGTLLVRGGTAAEGEGLYWVSAGQDGAPATQLVASTGQSTAVTYVRTDVPDVIDFDRDRWVPMGWHLSRSNVSVTVTVTHQRTGQSFVRHLQPRHESGDVLYGGARRHRLRLARHLRWFRRPDAGAQGSLQRRLHVDVPRGAENGVGPEVNESGTFKVVRSVKPHDYSDNGSPDVLTRDAAGKLWRIDTGHEPSYGTVQAGKPVETGTGWQIYDRIEATGNLSDLTGDEKPDVLATDPAGGLWLYPGTGNANAPLAPRQKMGTGWGIYNQITSTGNIGGAPAGDLVARHAAGDLWLYLGKGDGTFAPRTKIGTGWNTYSDVVAIGDANRDGRPDLIGHSPSDNTVYVYAGTGDWSVPFKGRTPTGMVGGSYNSWS